MANTTTFNNGKQLTNQTIDAYNLADRAERRQFPFGCLTWEASRLVYVCFDTNNIVGRKIHFHITHDVQNWMAGQLSIRPVPAGPSHTAYGYLATPASFNATSVPFIGNGGDGEIGTRGVNIVRQYLESINISTTDAQRENQLRGIDLIGEQETYEVKTRSERYSPFETLFYQLCETNSDRIIK